MSLKSGRKNGPPILSFIKKRLIIFSLSIIAFVLFSLVFVPKLIPQLAKTTWPMFRHDIKHTGKSPFIGPDIPFIKWNFNTNGWIYSNPAIGADGTIYIGCRDAGFYALNPDGSLKWHLFSDTPGIYNDTIRFTNETNGIGNTTRQVSVTINPKIRGLWISTPDNLSSSGVVGGPFSPSSISNTLENQGYQTLEWTASNSKNWITISPSGGTLNPFLRPGSSITFTVTINSNANSLSEGNYSDNIIFTNKTNGVGNTTRIVNLAVIDSNSGILSISPVEGFESSGTDGGSIFAPSSITYTLKNTGYKSINWIASKTNDWLSLSTSSGTLAPSLSTKVIVEINSKASTLAVDSYSDTISFANKTNSISDTTRSVSLIINPLPGGLSIYPSDGISFSVIENPSNILSKTYTLVNTGNQIIDWSAEKIQEWLTLSATSGTLAPGSSTTVTASTDTRYPSRPQMLTAPRNISSSAAIAADGTIYIASRDHRLYAINPDGTIKWRSLDTGSLIISSPAIAPDGTIYIPSLYTATFFAFNPNGTLKWRRTTSGGSNWSSPAIADDGTIYIGTLWDSNLYALNPDGSTKWVFHLEKTGGWEGIDSSPTIGNDDTIYFGARDHNVYALNPDGTEKWRFTTGDRIYSSPAIESNGTIYIGSTDGYLYALNPDGTEKWKFKAGKIFSSPVIDANGIIYFGSRDNNFYALKPDGTEKWRMELHFIQFESPSIGNDGTIYVPTYYVGPDESNFYAIGSLITTLSIQFNPPGGGTVTKNPDKTLYNYGESVELTATANTGYTFSGWAGDVSSGKENDNPLTITMDSNKDLTANFSVFKPTISGSVKNLLGQAISEVTLTFLDGEGTTTTGTNGNYTHTVSYNWSGTVTPSKTGYSFSPGNRTFSNISSNQINQDYTASVSTYTVSGNVSLPETTEEIEIQGGLSGVVMSGFPNILQTDEEGNYSATVDYGWSGTVTPTKAGYAFSPETRTYTSVTSDQADQDYTASVPTYTVFGNVSLPETTGDIEIQGGLSGVVISGFVDPLQTDEEGNYSAIVDYGWSGTVTPIKAGYAFSPETRTYTSVTSDQSNQNFIATLLIPPEISLSTDALNFGATTSGATTSDQQLRISNSGERTLNWSVMDDADWLSCDPTAGINAGVVTVSVDPSGKSAGTYTGTITISDSNASNSPQTVAVILAVKDQSDCTDPFGSYDTPIDGTSGVTGAIPVTGWVLDDIGTESVKIYRDPVSGEQTEDIIYIGDAMFVEGARADVEQAYPDYPQNYQAGWGYMMLTNFLPGQGNGTYRIHAIATDKDGHEVSLGTKTITCKNANAIKPFGAIDTPTQGGTVTGPFWNSGWALTPLPNSIPTDGSTINVWVDGVRLGNPAYNQYRNDIASLFPGYENTDGAVGAYYLDTTTYENGVHTIAWSVVDNAGNSDGIGSRFFTIANTGGSAQTSIKSHKEDLRPSISYGSIVNMPPNFDPVRFKRGYKQEQELKFVRTDEYGLAVIEMREVERAEIVLGNGVMTGYMVVVEKLRPLPIGSTLDTEKGIFYWQLGPGFIGEYDLVFIKVDEFGMQKKINVRVRIVPKFGRNPINFFKDVKSKSVIEDLK